MYATTFVAFTLTATIAPAQPAGQGAADVQVQIVDEKMCCNGCAQKVASQLYALPGVKSVEADVPNRLVTVTAQPSSKLTLDRIWHAVQQAKGQPSKLVTPRATYSLTGPENLKPEQRMPVGRYSLVVRTMDSKESAQQIAHQLYAVQGVTKVSMDLAQQALFIESADKAVLSPLALAGAVERAGHEPIAVGGPHGLLTIERQERANATAAANRNYPQTQGGIR